MLHAYSLKLKHPRTKEEMAFQAPLPEDFLKGLRSNGIEINSEFRIHNYIGVFTAYRKQHFEISKVL